MSWLDDHVWVFISHASRDHALASGLRDALHGYAMDGFVAPRGIRVLDDWATALETALGSCHALVALVTDQFTGSVWCNQEVGYALGHGRPVVAVAVGAEPPGFIGRHQAIPGRDRRVEEVAGSVFEALGRDRRTRADIIASLERRVAACRSIVDAGRLLEHARLLGPWETGEGRAVLDALGRNPRLHGRQVCHALRELIDR